MPKYQIFRRYRFNSLQTGRCIQSIKTSNGDVLAPTVSIPFKREGVSKVEDTGFHNTEKEKVSIPFKREGVSKEGHPECFIPEVWEEVSIPFKREGVSKDYRYQGGYRLISFNSLQTGRCIQRRIRTRKMTSHSKTFQFPSNGKVYPKARVSRDHLYIGLVSIPFKREGVSKGLVMMNPVSVS